MKLEGKNIILTGASSGIGLEMLQLLLGYKDTKIVAVARNIDSILPIDAKLFPLSVDISTSEGVDTLFEFAKQKLNSIDIFIANAGLAYIEELRDSSWEHIEYIHKLNVFSPIYSLQKLISQSKGQEIHFACTISGAGLASLPYYALYCSSKAALHHFMETFRYESPANLKLTSIYPVATKTKFFDKASNKENFPKPFPEQDAKIVAKYAIRGIEKNKRKVYPSSFFKYLYPIGRAFPFFIKIYSKLEKRKIKSKFNI